MKKSILVTGGTGRLAHYVIEYLVDKGYRVTGFDRVSPDPEVFPKDVQFVLGNLTSLEDCMRAVSLSEADAIIHLGAITHDTVMQPGSTRIQRLPEDECMVTNTMGTYYMLDAARRFKHVQSFIGASSYYALGVGSRPSGTPFQVDYLPIDEEHPLRPEDSYGLSKLLNEETMKAFSRAYGIRTMAFRLQGIDYPFQKERYQYGITIKQNPDHKGGPRGTTYQYLDPRDAAQAFMLAIEADNLEPFEAFYLQTDSRHVEDTKEVVAKVWPDLVPLANHLEGNEGLITGKKLREKLGYEPQYSWRNEHN